MLVALSFKVNFTKNKQLFFKMNFKVKKIIPKHITNPLFLKIQKKNH